LTARYSRIVRATSSSTVGMSVTPDVAWPALQMSRQRFGRCSRAATSMSLPIASAPRGGKFVGIETRGRNRRPQHVGLQAGEGRSEQDVIGRALEQHRLVSRIGHAFARRDELRTHIGSADRGHAREGRPASSFPGLNRDASETGPLRQGIADDRRRQGRQESVCGRASGPAASGWWDSAIWRPRRKRLSAGLAKAG
jgi:hypothetical protein